MITSIDKNSNILLLLKTKPLNEKPKRWSKPFWRLSCEREELKKDIVSLKYAWYTHKEIADYFNISKATIDVIATEEKKELDEYYKQDKMILLFSQIDEIDKQISLIKNEMSLEKDRNVKIKYHTILLKYIQEKENLLGLKTNTLNITTDKDPLDQIFEIVKNNK